MKNEVYGRIITKAFDQLLRGAFLTSKAGDAINTMTISWGFFGFAWNRPIMQVMVRDTRHTKTMMDESDTFTVSFPFKGELKDALKVCGSKSGRDLDKFLECDLKPLDSSVIDAPGIEGARFVVECKVVAKQRMTKEEMLSDDIKTFYGNDNFHTMYYGEVVNVYKAG